MFERFINWFLSLFDCRLDIRQEFEKVAKGFAESGPLSARVDEPWSQLWRIQFRHRGCDALVATYRGPLEFDVPHLVSANWTFHDGTKPRFGSSDTTICPDCGRRVPCFGSATLEEMDRFKIIPGYRRVVPGAAESRLEES